MNIHPNEHFDNTGNGSSNGNGANGNAGAFDQDEYDFDIARVAALPEEQRGAEIKLLAEKYKAFDIGKQLLKKHIKEASAEAAKAARAAARKEREAERARGEKAADGRVRCEAPYADGPRTEVMRLLDKALTTEEAEPPMRDLYWTLTEARMREPVGVHILTAESVNTEEEAAAKRLPPPPILSLIAHDRHSLGLLIEKHIEFYKLIETKSGDIMEVTVALSQPFIEAFLAYRDSELPRVWTISTMPIVLQNGELLATNGLDRKRKVLFRIDPGITELLPKGEVTDADVVAAMNFLTDEWLCDVLTDYDGKCVLISMSESILQRAQFSERPCFSVPAGKRESGKTTVVNMIAIATTGSPAPAAAWSSNDEERRKTIFALARQNLAFVAWDNIKRGTAISCQHLEKALTAEVIEDRVLCTSDFEIAPSSTIFAFTGNGTIMKGDLASRTLVARLTADRPDPANREFRHPRPLEWTHDHRAEILRALYVILLGSPRLGQAEKGKTPAKTRFKAWWSLIGAAIEHAAKLAGHEVDFERLVELSKGEDEEEASLVDGLEALDRMAAKEGVSSGFTGNMVRGWCGDYTEGGTLKSFFHCKPEASPTTSYISAQLRSHVDEPVAVGHEIWTLKMSSGLTRANVKEFHIHKQAAKVAVA
jgi:hypothetical protein